MAFEGDENVGDSEDGLEPALLLVARGLTGDVYIICGAGASFEGMVSEVEATEVEELELFDDPPDGVGLWVWAGRIGLDAEEDAAYDGDWRRPTSAEALAIADGRDPWPDGPGTWWE